MASVCVKHDDDLGLSVPARDVILDELKVEDRRWKIVFNCKAPTLKTTFTSVSFTGMSMVSDFSETDTSRLL